MTNLRVFSSLCGENVMRKSFDYNQHVCPYSVSLMFDSGSAGKVNGSGKMSGVTKLRISTNKALNKTGIAISSMV